MTSGCRLNSKSRAFLCLGDLVKVGFDRQVVLDSRGLKRNPIGRPVDQKRRRPDSDQETRVIAQFNGVADEVADIEPRLVLAGVYFEADRPFS